MAVVVKDVAYVLVHVPDFVRYGSKPSRDIAVEGGSDQSLERKIQGSLRSFEEAVAYPPNQVFIGNLHPDALHTIPQPWYAHPVPGAQRLGETFLPSRIDDFGPYIQTVLSANADVCLSHLGVKDWLGFYQTAGKQGYFRKVTHFELEMGNLESLVSMRKKAPEGIWGVSAFPFWGLGWKESNEFVAKYKDNTGAYPSLAALSGYITVYAIYQTIKKAGATAPEKTLSTLEDLGFRTPVGQMTIRKTDHRAMWPIWCGSTQSSSDYPFPILGNLKALGPDSFSP